MGMAPFVALLILVNLLAYESRAGAVPDVYRPHSGVLLKTKLCMRCRQTLSASAMTAQMRSSQTGMLPAATGAAMAAKAAARDAEASRAATAAALGDAMYGTDPFDAARVKMDAAMDLCVPLSGSARAACMAAARGGPSLVVDDPSNIPGYGAQLPPASAVIPNSVTDPRGLLPDPRKAFSPPTGNEPVNKAQIRPPFSTFLESGAVAAAASRVAGTPGDPDGTLFGISLAPPSVGGMDTSQTVADMPLCVNEGSRRFIYSLFRAMVGSLGDVQCIDIAAPTS